MSHEVEIAGCLNVPEDADFDKITDLFLEFVESHGWTFGGGFTDIRDGQCVRPFGKCDKLV